MKVKDLPDAERPLFKMRYFGAETLSNTELIQLLTGVSDFETASRILEISDGIQNLYKMSTEEFETIDGVGEATAVRIMASIELNKRYSLPSYKETRIYEAEDVYRMFAAESQGQFQEIVTALLIPMEDGGTMIVFDVKSEWNYIADTDVESLLCRMAGRS